MIERRGFLKSVVTAPLVAIGGGAALASSVSESPSFTNAGAAPVTFTLPDEVATRGMRFSFVFHNGRRISAPIGGVRVTVNKDGLVVENCLVAGKAAPR
jgi:hypothetical protein